MGSLNLTLRETTCSSLLLWSAVLLLLLPSLRLSPRPRLILLLSMETMPATHMLPDMPDTAMDTHMPMAFMERDLLMLSQRLMPTTMVMLDLMPDMDTQLTDTTERDLLMLSQRLMPTTDTLVMLDLMLMDTDHTDTQLMVTMERDPLMLSLRLMLTMVSMDMDMLLLMLMVLTHIPMVLTEESGDKLNATQLKEAQKQTTNINDTQFPKNKLNYCWCRNLS